MVHKIIRIQLSAIYLTAALLFVAVMGFVGSAVFAVKAEPYPNLRVDPVGEFIRPAQKTIYFTFDDGPSKNTRAILDVLKKQGVKATFFVTAQNAGRPDTEELLCRIVAEGHSLGLHSYSHTFHEIYRSVDSYLADIDKLNDYLYQTVGTRPKILRFPGGSATANASPSVMKRIIKEITDRGYQYYDWNVVSGDDTPTVYDPGYLADRVVNGAKDLDVAVILFHDSPAPVTTAQAVDLAIDRLRELGFGFDCLTEAVEPVHLKTNRF